MPLLLPSSSTIIRGKSNQFELLGSCLKIKGVVSLIFLCFFSTYAQPTLVKDINTDPAYIYNNSLSPENLTAVNGVVYFTGSSEKTGRELWRSDGTAAGTYQVKDINPGISSSNPSYLLNVNGTLFFIVNYRLYYDSDESGPNPDASKGSGFELWKSDGTEAGTIKVGDFSLKNRQFGWLYNIPVRFINVNGTLFFTANNSFDDYTLYKSDGTMAGTQPVTQVKVSDNYYSTYAFLESAGKYIYYNQLDPDSEDGHESLWRTDGTPAGTIRLLGPSTEQSYSLLRQISNINGTLFFSAPGPLGQELWKSDGTPEGTVLVKDIVPGPESSDPIFSGRSANFLYFSTNNDTSLWKSDGTSQGTVLVKNGWVYPTVLPGPGEQVYLLFSDATYGRELWKSDGTAQGTILLKDINPGATSSGISDLVYMNGLLYFTANDGVNGRALWKSDGTAAGTLMVKDINPGTTSYAIAGLTIAQNTLFFSGQTTQDKSDLWKSDGTAAGTVLVKELNETTDRTQSSAPTHFTNVNGLLYFTTSITNGFELWKSDGTEAGTIFIKRNGGSGYKQTARVMDHINNMVYYRVDNYDAKDNLLNIQVWETDGSNAGTTLIKTIDGLTNYYYQGQNIITTLNNTIYFFIHNQLWKTDGTAAGTLLLKKDLTGNNHDNLTVVNNTLFFRSGPSIWKSDGSAAGTVEVKNVGNYGSAKFTAYKNLLYFITPSGLWNSDGTAKGTKIVSDLMGTGTLRDMILTDSIFYLLTHRELWKSDGTQAGTVMIKDLNNNDVDNQFNGLTYVNGILYFTYYNWNGVSHALWRSNGTATGTQRMLTLDNTLYGVQALTGVNNTLLFITDDGVQYQLWKSNGTTETTEQVTIPDLSVKLFNRAIVNNVIYFSADNGQLGFELWKYNPTTCVAVNKNLLVQGNTVCMSENGKITLKASQSGISYQAYFHNSPVGNPVQGGGDITLTIPTVSLSVGNNTFTIKASGCTLTELTTKATISVYNCPTISCSNSTQSSLVVNPSSGGTLSGTSLYLKTIPGASSYTLQVSSSANFTTGVITKTTSSRLSTGTYYASFPELALNQKYYVRVYTNLGLCWGSVTSFTTASAAGSAYVTNPSDGGTTTGTSLYLNTVSGATTYTLQVSTSADFTSNVLTRATVSRLSTGTYYALFPELILNQKYYVRVKTNLSELWGRTTSFTRVSAVARLAAEALTESLENRVSVYPNPFKDKLTIVSAQAGKLYITIADNLGRIVHQTTTQGAQTELNLAHLKQGVYVVKVSTEDGQTLVLRVVKQ
ncbi:T9SS type A sorting domain-containing protein [Rhodocytophaga rosea]|uniref:T9SS type A sorting domain-containing protein n=1 Tax=Rhodocytophaga rosea TaxID=2704465 RepID=A0A6C0GS24_9BACT|nr:ELWxxDGT repeat protein [Rhodocytophaga rosea]QHT70895.1 T9SS type A sorting domain-containing protein [Rhodocytophaga rosea]